MARTRLFGLGLLVLASGNDSGSGNVASTSAGSKTLEPVFENSAHRHGQGQRYASLHQRSPLVRT